MASSRADMRRVKYTRNYGHYKKCGALDDERQTWRTSLTSVDSAKYKQQNEKGGNYVGLLKLECHTLY